MNEANENQSTPEPTPVEDKMADAKAKVEALGTQDKMVLLGSLALVVLFLLPWYSFSAAIGGVKVSHSGLIDAFGWIGWLAAIAATALALTRAGILKVLPPDVQALARQTKLTVALTALALLAGPLYFWTQTRGATSSELAEAVGVSAGKTFFFFLALVAALVAAGGAAWKLKIESTKS